VAARLPGIQAPGLELKYVLRVYGPDGHFDQTRPLPIWIVDQQAGDIGEKDAEKEVERIYIVPLRRAKIGPTSRAAPRAVDDVRHFLMANRFGFSC
jgi:hypothetical protein